MRDINRIDVICDRLKELWKKSPDMRLGQLICNISGSRSVLFYIEDEILQEMFEKWDAALEADSTQKGGQD